MASYGELRMKRRRITVPSLVMRMLPQRYRPEQRDTKEWHGIDDEHQ